MITPFKNLMRYIGQKSHEATAMYIDIAEHAGISPAQLALSFVNDRPFVTSTIIGATNMDQLKENIESIYVKLSPEIITQIEAVHKEISNPAP